MMLRGWIWAALVVGLASNAQSAEPDTLAATTLKRPRPTASAPT